MDPRQHTVDRDEHGSYSVETSKEESERGKADEGARCLEMSALKAELKEEEGEGGPSARVAFIRLGPPHPPAISHRPRISPTRTR